MTITEFIAARLNKDEAVLRKARNAPEHANRFIDANPWDEDLIAAFASEKRIEREVEAKRKILAAHAKADEWVNVSAGATAAYARQIMNDSLHALAAIWDDHPDWQEAWRPC